MVASSRFDDWLFRQQGARQAEDLAGVGCMCFFSLNLVPRPRVADRGPFLFAGVGLGQMHGIHGNVAR